MAAEDDVGREWVDWLVVFVPVAIFLLLLGFWLLCHGAKFDLVSCCYDWLMGHSERTKMHAIREMVVPFCRGAVLDIGAGTGPNIELMPASVASVTLLDRSTRMLAKAHEKLDARADIEHGQTMVANLEHLDGIASASFDTVLSVDVFCSVGNPRLGMAEAVRVLRPGGLFLFAEHGHSPSALRNAVQCCATVFTMPLMSVSYMRDVEALAEGSGLRIDSKQFVPHTSFVVYRMTKPGGEDDVTPANGARPAAPGAPVEMPAAAASAPITVEPAHVAVDIALTAPPATVTAV